MTGIMRHLGPALVILLGTVSLNARAEVVPETSLFFTESDIDSIREAIALSGVPRPVVEVERINRLLLSGIVYIGPKEWTVWLNGVAVTPARMPIQVKSITVTPQSVTVAWQRVAGQPATTITLYPNRPHQFAAIVTETVP
ncbi:MAG: hypothetical protein WCK65_13200, partial [Rhodospirillaceae bacterium]